MSALKHKPIKREDAIVAGETHETWSKKLIPALKENGWWGATSQKPDLRSTAEGHLDAIYDANMQASYAAGSAARLIISVPIDEAGLTRACRRSPLRHELDLRIYAAAIAGGIAAVLVLSLGGWL